MSRETYIISSAARINEAQVIHNSFSKSDFSPKMVVYNRISDIYDTTQIEETYKTTDITEKNYLKDESWAAAWIIKKQSKDLNRILSMIPENATVYICEEYIPEYFFIKKSLFRKSQNFFTFGKIIDSNLISISKSALDIGAKLDNHFNILTKATGDHTEAEPEFNGTVVIDPPPDSIPYSHLGYFRSPKIFTNALISFLDFYYKERRHPKIKVIAPQKPASCYEISKRANQIIEFLGKRAEIIESTSEIEKGSTVVTWSTRQFFSLRSEGFLSLPATKCGASFLFRKTKGIKELILEKHSENEIDILLQFYRDNSISE